jgi:hypothetical protein
VEGILSSLAVRCVILMLSGSPTVGSGRRLRRPLSVVPTAGGLTSSNFDWGRAVFEFIADEYGLAGIRRYLMELKDGATNSDALQTAFGLTSDAFDREFARYVRSR